MDRPVRRGQAEKQQVMLGRLTIAALPMGITLQDTKAIEGDILFQALRLGATCGLPIGQANSTERGSAACACAGGAAGRQASPVAHYLE